MRAVFSSLALGFEPVLIRMAFAAAFLLIELMGVFGDLLLQVGGRLGEFRY